MPTIIVSLGTIVRTDASKAIQAFQAVADQLQLGLQVPQLMPQLQLLFLAFNLGELSIKDFKGHVSKIFFEKAQKQDDASKKTFSEKFSFCWNAMCVVDTQAEQILKYIAELLKENPDSIKIYSDTNALHFENIKSFMTTCGLNPDIVQTTFANVCSKHVLLQSIVNGLRSHGTTETITLILGKNDQITDPVLHAMTAQRDARVTNTASCSGLKIEHLTEPRLSIECLEKHLGKARRCSIIPKFHQEVMQQGRDSPRPDLKNSTEGTTDEPPLERQRSPSPPK